MRKDKDVFITPAQKQALKDWRGNWWKSLAVSCLHKALRRGDVNTAAYCAGWLLQNREFKMNAWRRILSFPSEELSGEGIERVNALYQAWKDCYEDDNLFAAIIYLCRLVNGEATPQRKPGDLNREADELKNAVIFWMQAGKTCTPLPEAWDCHMTGHVATLDEFWEYANRLGPASQWRADAVQAKEETGDRTQVQMNLLK